MIQEQVLSYVLENKSMAILLNNNITSEYFLEYEDEYNFIKDHYDKYKIVPDIETFLDHFTDADGNCSFDLIEVNETEKYLIDTLREEFLFARTVPVIKQAAKLLKSDANEASHYLQSEIKNLTPHYNTPFVDIIHSDQRVRLFENKTQNPDAWFIPTGFEELDDIINGLQRGEEYVVIYARTGQGKSWVIAKMMQHSWMLGENVGYISPEMSADKIGYRFDTLNNHFSNRALVRGDTSALAVADYQSYFDTISSKENRFLVSTPIDFDKKITVSKLRNFVIENKLTVLAIDGITYLTDERYKRGDNKTTTLTNISEDLMQLSNELKIPILVVVQSNRGGIKEDPNATPELEDIRDSDGISHNATKVISLRQKGDALLMEIKKHRDGAFGKKLTYLWDIDTGDFTYTTSTDDDVKDEVKDEVKGELKKRHKKEGKVVF